jgi:aspartyl-tRNA(Asn)/glutamyl-tRNA(Gln) amidotransferase subunit A
VEDVDMPILGYSVPMYYTIMPAEVSTNLARFDGIKFGLQDDMTKFDSLVSYYEKVRSEGFGNEVKRRILL